MRAGIVGGSSIFDLGDVAAMRRFSTLVLELSDDFPDAGLLHDRIFRTYVRLEDMGGAYFLVRHVRMRLSESTGVDYARRIGYAADNLRNFDPYFDAFEHCAESATYFYHRWKILKPVRVARVDMPAWLRDSSRSLETIGLLADTDLPFWQQGVSNLLDSNDEVDSTPHRS